MICGIREFGPLALGGEGVAGLSGLLAFENGLVGSFRVVVG